MKVETYKVGSVHVVVLELPVTSLDTLHTATLLSVVFTLSSLLPSLYQHAINIHTHTNDICIHIDAGGHSTLNNSKHRSNTQTPHSSEVGKTLEQKHEQTWNSGKKYWFLSRLSPIPGMTEELSLVW